MTQGIHPLQLLESGNLTEQNLDSLAEWAKGFARTGQGIGAISQEGNIKKYFKCLTPDGSRFLYLGSDVAFETFTKATKPAKEPS